MHTGKPEHLSSFDYRGPHRYFLTFCTNQRTRHFTTADRVALVWAQFQRAAEQEPFALLAYCFMPDHVHLLVQGQTEAADVRLFIARAKQLSGFHFKHRFGVPLWQRYGYERVLRGEDDTLSVARYILENPVRARLVADPKDYPYSRIHQIHRPPDSGGDTDGARYDVVRLKPDTTTLGPAEGGHYDRSISETRR